MDIQIYEWAAGRLAGKQIDVLTDRMFGRHTSRKDRLRDKQTDD